MRRISCRRCSASGCTGRRSLPRRTTSGDGCSASAAVTPEELGLLDHVAALPESQRTVLHLHYYEGYTLREIARLLGVTVPTVKMRLKRGRDALRNTWEESL